MEGINMKLSQGCHKTMQLGFLWEPLQNNIMDIQNGLPCSLIVYSE